MVAAVPEKKRFSRSKFLGSREWSSLQRDLFDWAVNGRGHGFVDAKAGAGKSTSLVGIVASLPAKDRIAVVAFNRHSVDDLKKKMPSTVSVSTAHSFGLSALVRFFGEVFRPNDGKMRDLTRQVIDKTIAEATQARSDEKKERSRFWLELRNGLISKDRETQKKAKVIYRSIAAFLENVVHYAICSFSPLDSESLWDLVEYFCIELPDCGTDTDGAIAREYLLPMVEGLIAESTTQAIEQKNVSLDELLYLPVVLNLSFPAYDFVLQDECQDASSAMLALVERMAGHGRLISVGDKNQAIQGFAGSDAYSVDRILEKFNPTQLSLSVCYRCPSSHLDLARRIVPGIQDKPGAIAGEIRVIAQELMMHWMEPGDLVICRFTAPLIATCLDLIQKEIKARVRGRDIGRQLTALVDAAAGDFPGEFVFGLKNYCKPRIQKMREDERDSEAQNLEDRMLAVLACFDGFGMECRSRHDFSDRILGLFCDDDEHSPVTLSTIHRAKGDEAERVWILGSNSLPFLQKCKHEWQEQQEWNLAYVALTRSKHSLFLVPLGKDVSQALAHPLGGLNLPPAAKPLHDATTKLPDPQPQTIDPCVRWQESEDVKNGFMEATARRKLDALMDRHISMIPIVNHYNLYKVANGAWGEAEQHALTMLGKDAIAKSSMRMSQVFLYLVQWLNKKDWETLNFDQQERSRLAFLANLEQPS